MEGKENPERIICEHRQSPRLSDLSRYAWNSTGTISDTHLKDTSPLKHGHGFPQITTGPSTQKLSY